MKEIIILIFIFVFSFFIGAYKNDKKKDDQDK
jgi:cytochrome c1